MEKLTKIIKQGKSILLQNKRRNLKMYYPFSAIVGQKLMKKALILNAINPKLGGVLIRGEKGFNKHK